MAQQRLTEELVAATFADYSDTLRETAKSFQCGYATADDCRDRVVNAFYKHFWLFLRDHHLKLQLDAKNYEQFISEYHRFQSEKDSPKLGCCSWLCDIGGATELAAENDRILFFSLLKQFDLAPSLFEPVPDGVIVPNRIYCHQYHDCSSISILFNCVDDGGLLIDENPVGKRFTLVSDIGLKAEVTIKEDRRKENRAGLDFDELVYHTKAGPVIRKAEFLAAGSIEGYTAKEGRERPEILIRTGKKDQIDRLSYWEYADDHRAFLDHPVWQEFFRLDRKHLEKWEAYHKKQFEAYLEQSKYASSDI